MELLHHGSVWTLEIPRSPFAVSHKAAPGVDGGSLCLFGLECNQSLERAILFHLAK